MDALSPIECALLKVNPRINPRTGRMINPCAPGGSYAKMVRECECMMANNPRTYGALPADPRLAALGLATTPATSSSVTGMSNLSNGTMYWEVLVEGRYVSLKEGVIGGIPITGRWDFGTQEAASKIASDSIKWMMSKGFHP